MPPPSEPDLEEIEASFVNMYPEMAQTIARGRKSPCSTEDAFPTNLTAVIEAQRQWDERDTQQPPSSPDPEEQQEAARRYAYEQFEIEKKSM